MEKREFKTCEKVKNIQLKTFSDKNENGRGQSVHNLRQPKCKQVDRGTYVAPKAITKINVFRDLIRTYLLDVICINKIKCMIYIIIDIRYTYI